MASKVNSTQVLILQTIAKVGPLTHQQISDKIGIHANGNLGPIQADVTADHADSLLGRKLVKRTRSLDSDDSSVLWELTAAGVKAAGTLKTRGKLDDNDKVPAKLLDGIVCKFKTTRTYGLELYTDTDLKAIRDALGDSYAAVKLDAIRQQITNRRKQGAYADPNEKIRTAVERTIRDFGPEGRYGQVLTAKQVAQLEQLAATDA